MKVTFSLKKYIMQAARKLKVYETFHSKQLFETGIGTVMVARQKPNGDILFCLFLVDVFCLGVKDVLYRLVDQEAYDVFKEDANLGSEDIIHVTPNFAYNIVYGAVEYAEDLGFKPHKDFNIAEYILGNIDKLVYEEVEFGQEGKPHFFAGPFDNVNRVIATLDKTVGKGNYHFTVPMPEDEEFIPEN